ncbi:cytochrome c oxidase assembly protein COX16 homolog, mitochondrial [Pseudomyrmex gracilis]|uniref:cytochrome c oxidase assembly protein COX16 homolog, mitochondrial n=1 Tax=Pseudomyrmex gracilis TaxID=219809 RepID=UPI00099524A9|nr:cytochrome c oxidase assembly protein COX16 homolog, mitochondrial [Pseudomyrmex gracilis]
MSYSRSWKYGIPFMIFILGGSYALREFTELRYTYRKVSGYNIRGELEKEGIQMRLPEEITLEKEYEKLEKMDVDNWENIRISRPWDETEQAKL